MACHLEPSPMCTARVAGGDCTAVPRLPCSGPVSAPCFLSSCPQLEGMLAKAKWIVSQWALLKILRRAVSDPCPGGVRKGGVL